MRTGLCAAALLLLSSLAAWTQEAGLSISSPAFSNGGLLPAKYTQAGGNISPALKISGLPPKTVSYALLMDDPDADSHVSIHWLVGNFLPSTKTVDAGRLPREAVVGLNSWNQTKYNGPAPTARPHRYFIRVYALDVVLDLKQGFTREDFITLISGHLLGTAQMGALSSGTK